MSVMDVVSASTAIISLDTVMSNPVSLRLANVASSRFGTDPPSRTQVECSKVNDMGAHRAVDMVK